ncbi:MAG: hypothetical protein ACE5IJ_03180 [Thermoplasmata archaeon]
MSEAKGEHPGITDEFVLGIAENSSVFGGTKSREDICGVLISNPKSNMTGKALKQLVALWLNVVSGLVDSSAGIHLGT